MKEATDSRRPPPWDVRSWLEEHRLEETIAEAVADAVQKRSHDPLRHVANFLNSRADEAQVRSAATPELRVDEARGDAAEAADGAPIYDADGGGNLASDEGAGGR